MKKNLNQGAILASNLLKLGSLTLGVFLLISGAIAQTNSAPPPSDSPVFLTPEQTNGFVVWMDTDSVQYWEVVIVDRVPTTDSTYYEERVWRHEEWSNNYVFIPEEYRPEGVKNQYSVRLYGKTRGHDVVVEEDVIPFLPEGGADPWYATCFRICNGTSYAWKVTQWVNSANSQSMYELTGASHYDPDWEDPYTGELGGYVPYYEYMTTEVYNTVFLGNQYASQEYYDIPSDAWSGLPWEEYYTIKVNNSSDVSYYNVSGTAIQDPEFRGVRKAMGPWNGLGYLDKQTNNQAYGTFGGLCVNNSLVYAMMLMNSSSKGANISPTLECHPSQNMSSVGSGWTGDMSQCHDELLNNFDDYPDIGSVIQNWLHCIEGLNPNGGGSSGNGGGVWEELHHIKISLVDGGVMPVFSKRNSDLFDSNGDFVPFSTTLAPGLYRVEIARTGLGAYTPEAYFEIKDRTQFSVNLADLFDFTIFPVPHINDDFEINMKAFANLKVSYSLFDSNGMRIHQNNYNLRNGHDEDHEIISRNPLPTGLLIHRFDFEDGSYKTATTYKNP